jgi:hypothetical protein
MQEKTEAIAMDIGSTIDRWLSPVEKNAGLIGAGLSALFNLQNGSLTNNVGLLMQGKIHFPNISEFTQLFSDPNFMTPAAAALVGYILKGSTNNATLKKVGGIAQGLGTGYAAVEALLYAIYSVTHSNPTGNGSSRSGGSSGYGY